MGGCRVMDFAASFTAIDFETANRRSDSACQLAAVVVREGKIVDSFMWMIRPTPLFFSQQNIRIHGITPEQVRGESDFGELWPDISAKLEGECLVAHNAGFDIGVLLACLRTHGASVPDLQFTCTRTIARRTWPNRRRYGLKPLAEWLGIRFRHHDALEDSIACAKVLLAAGIDNDAKNMADLEKKLRINRGAAGEWGHRGPRKRTSKPRTPTVSHQPPLPFHWPGQSDASKQRQAPVSASPDASPTAPETRLDLQRLMIRAEFIRPLAGRSIVFSGRLRTMSNQQARSLAMSLGGQCEESVTDTTDLIVLGSGTATPAPEKQDPHASGSQVRFMNEEEFLGLIIAKDE